MKKYSKKVLFFSMILVLFIDMSLAGGVSADDTVINSSFFRAFADLAQGETAWPVYRVEDGSITVDGEYSPAESWGGALPIYVAGEWQWNERFRLQPWLFESGVKDFLAVWRLAYDSRYLYISCDFRDDNHQEGSAREPWIHNDCAEFTFIRPACEFPKMADDSESVEVKIMQVYRKFIESSGLRGRLIRVVKSSLNNLVDTVYVNDVDEGANSLGGMLTAAKPWVTRAYPGRWFMEARIPICMVANLNGKDISLLVGQQFKMNLKVYDDDSSGIYSSKYPTVGLGLERYKAWWAFNNGKIIDPLPTFILSGYAASGKLIKPAPDLFNLYCGRNTEYYESFCDGCNTSLEFSASRRHEASFPLISIQPNPVSQGSFFSVVIGEAAESNGTLFIYDARGIQLYSSQVNRQNIVINRNISAGRYLLRYVSSLGTHSGSFSVIR